MKKNEFKSLTREQLIAKHAELSTILSKMKFSHGVTNLENPLQIRHIRRDIARINTYLSASN
jgi:large subunit ribosomal protein L29